MQALLGAILEDLTGFRPMAPSNGTCYDQEFARHGRGQVNRRLIMPRPKSSPVPSSDAFLAAIVNSSTDAIISKDVNGVITSWNKGAQKIFGYTAEEAVGQPISILFPPDRQDEEPDLLARIRAGEVIEHFETVRKRKDGALLDISLTVSPIHDEQGNIIGASKIARDITRLKRVQEKLRVTLSSIGDAVIATDSDGLVEFMNSTAEKLTRWSESEARGQPLERIFNIVSETNRRPVDSPISAALRERRVVGLANHTVLIAKDGSEHPVDDSAAPILDPRDNLIGGVLVFRDVSHRRQIELAALRLAAIVEGTDDAIISKDLNGIVTSWNPAAERIFGFTADEMLGQSITKLIPPDRLDEESQILSRLRRGDRIDHFLTVRRRKDGQLIHVSLTISPIRNKDGEIVGASKIARDVTALKRTQDELQTHAAELENRVRERTARLQETVSELEAFSYSLSHDMRAPLRAIQGFAEVIIEDQAYTTPESLEHLRKIIAAANRMDRLIRDVLNFARFSRAEIEVSSVNLDELVRDLIHERPELQAPRAIISIDHPLVSVKGHAASLTQCLTNLLDNAVKFMPPGKQPRVRVYTEVHGEKVRICVADNGIGIEKESQGRLFGIFERLNSPQIYHGTGVGLAIVRRAAERMNGTVGVNSAVGLGSTFWIELPKP
ncbi:MAG TPA: PAS domain S-box protein [Opitutaceae bacterium]|nr:PAS domain S-box protein [Opitutaceae bacterium]